MIELSSPAPDRASCACLMIVRDADQTVEGCLNSVLEAGAFDQIIIVIDSRTKDRTSEILSGYALRYANIELYLYKWQNQDFSEARNYGLERAKTQYAFWIDADDVVLDPAGIRRLLERPMGAAYYFRVLIPGPGGSYQETKHLRLFPLLPGVRWELPVHEQVIFSLRRAGVREIDTKYRILHLGYTSNEVVSQKHLRNYRIMHTWLPKGKNKEHLGRRYIEKQYEKSRRYLSAVRQREGVKYQWRQ